jgi:hypothetical protein
VTVRDQWKMMACWCQHPVVTVMTHHCCAGTCGAEQLHAAQRFLLLTATRCCCCCCLHPSRHLMLNLAVILVLHLLLIAWLLLVMPQRASHRASQRASEMASERASQRQTMGLLLLRIAVPTSGGQEPHCTRRMNHRLHSHTDQSSS